MSSCIGQILIECSAGQGWIRKVQATGISGRGIYCRKLGAFKAAERAREASARAGGARAQPREPGHGCCTLMPGAVGQSLLLEAWGLGSRRVRRVGPAAPLQVTCTARRSPAVAADEELSASLCILNLMQKLLWGSLKFKTMLVREHAFPG